MSGDFLSARSGFWDHNDKAKPELTALKELFFNFSYKIIKDYLMDSLFK